MACSKDEELLSAYFDGELEGREAEALEARLAHGDAKLREELRAVKATRDAVCEWARVGGEEMSHNGPLWRAIEGRLGLNQKLEVHKKSAVPSMWLERIREMFSMPGLVGAGAFASVVLGALILWGPSQQEQQMISSSQQPSFGNLNSAVPVNLASGPQEAAVPGNVVRFASENISGEDVVGEGENLNVPIGEPLSTLVPEYAQDDQRGRRFRDANLDVEWLRSDKPVSVMAARSKSEPPVIWVAQR